MQIGEDVYKSVVYNLMDLMGRAEDLFHSTDVFRLSSSHVLSLLFFNDGLQHLKPPYELQSSVNTAQPAPDFSYNQAHFPAGHGPQHAGMMRQKSIGDDN